MAEKFVLVSSFSPLEKGDQFVDWPLHVTIMPWFSVPVERERAFRNALINRMHDVTPIVATGDSEAQFGPNKDVPVRVLKSMGGLAALHQDVLEVINRFDGTVDSPYVGKEYIAHVTTQGDEGISEGQEVHIDAVQLIKGDIDGPRTVEQVFSLANDER